MEIWSYLLSLSNKHKPSSIIKYKHKNDNEEKSVKNCWKEVREERCREQEK